MSPKVKSGAASTPSHETSVSANKNVPSRTGSGTTHETIPLSLVDTEPRIGCPDEAPSGISEGPRKRKRRADDSGPTSPRTRAKLEPGVDEATAAQSFTAAEPTKEARTSADPHNQEAAALSACTSSTAIPTFEWVDVTHTPERFLVRLQLRSFLLLFGKLAPPALDLKNLYFIESKLFKNPALKWTFRDMGKIMQLVLSIAGVDFLKEMKSRPYWKGRRDSAPLKRRETFKELIKKGFTDAMWEDFYEMVHGVDQTELDQNLATNRNRGKPCQRIRRPKAAEPAVKYELLRELIIIASACPRIRKQLEANEAATKQATNATKTACKNLKLELNAMSKDLKAQKKAGASEEAIRELEGQVKAAHRKISSISLTEWLVMRKLDPRSSQPIGVDPLGNVYYILPQVERLEGYASWVLCQKGHGLDHPLGQEWVEIEGDGGNTKDFYAIDGVEAVEVLVLVAKLQQFAEVLRLNAANAV